MCERSCKSGCQGCGKKPPSGLLERATAKQLLQIDRAVLALKAGLSHEGAQNLNEAMDIVRGLAEGRILRSHILPAGPFAQIDGLRFDFVRPALDESMSAARIQAVMEQYHGEPANKANFKDLLRRKRELITSMVAEKRLSFVLLGERGKAPATVAGTYGHETVLYYGWQDNTNDDKGPAPGFYEEDLASPLDSSHLALYVY